MLIWKQVFILNQYICLTSLKEVAKDINFLKSAETVDANQRFQQVYNRMMY